MTTMQLESVTTTKELETFGNAFGSVLGELETAKCACETKAYPIALRSLINAGKHLESTSDIKYIGAIYNTERRETYDLLIQFAQDEFASQARRILNMYCNGRNIR